MNIEVFLGSPINVSSGASEDQERPVVASVRLDWVFHMGLRALGIESAPEYAQRFLIDALTAATPHVVEAPTSIEVVQVEGKNEKKEW